MYAVCDPVIEQCTCAAKAIEIKSENNNTCVERKLVGSYCLTDLECDIGIVGDAVCNESTGKCECAVGSTSFEGGILCFSSANGLISGVSHWISIAVVLCITLVFK